MIKTYKRTILIDLDGVLNVYAGNFDENYIPEINCGAKEFLKRLSCEFDVKIFTTRNKLLTAKWLINYGIDKYVKDITNTKDLCWLYVDDRCLTFKGDYVELMKSIDMFKPWYK